MTNLEKREFEIDLLIHDKGKKIKFFKREKWEVEWRNNGKSRLGVVSPKKFQFEKDGKKYQVWVDVKLDGGWFFKNEVTDYHFKLPPNADYQIYYSNEPKPEPKPGERSKRDNYVILVNEWKVGNIVFLSSSILILIIIIGFIIRKSQKEKVKSIL